MVCGKGQGKRKKKSPGGLDSLSPQSLKIIIKRSRATLKQHLGEQKNLLNIAACGRTVYREEIVQLKDGKVEPMSDADEPASDTDPDLDDDPDDDLDDDALADDAGKCIKPPKLPASKKANRGERTTPARLATRPMTPSSCLRRGLHPLPNEDPISCQTDRILCRKSVSEVWLKQTFSCRAFALGHLDANPAQQLLEKQPVHRIQRWCQVP
ncbi:hypothetical protein F5Y05DRAFT_410981 [Hypoxylon sp. FL0543]|nr:hypothetical protein F5Y05DRAFT_410981 [Hypoxylon sp. FL0543]